MEVRRVPRVAVDWKVTLRMDKQVTHGRALQFSEYGMLVAPPEVAQVGQHYDLMFNVPGLPAAIKVRGIGVYSTAKGVGIRFEQVPPDVTTALRAYLTSIVPSPGA